MAKNTSLSIDKELTQLREEAISLSRQILRLHPEPFPDVEGHDNAGAASLIISAVLEERVRLRQALSEILNSRSSDVHGFPGDNKYSKRIRNIASDALLSLKNKGEIK